MTVDDLISAAKEYMEVDSKRLKAAYRFAEEAHRKQKRENGEPYITHPLQVALILAGYKADEDSLVAALLHDVVEDADFTLKDIRQDFGADVATMVKAVTKFPRTSVDEGHFSDYDFKTESLRLLLDLMLDDVRVVVIKLCDRLHNMQTLHYCSSEKQVRVARETLDIYVKIADRLSIYSLKEDLGFLCFRYLYPTSYDRLVQFRKTNRNDLFRLSEKISKHLDSTPISNYLRHFKARHDVLIEDFDYGDPLHGKFFLEAYVTVDSIEHCYSALGEIHKIWTQKKGSFEDYINTPKINGYQALETSVILADGTTVLFMIQTEEMYLYCRYGVMTTCFDGTPKADLRWVENLKRITQKTKGSSLDFMDALQLDVLKESIVVYGPDNSTLLLPTRSTLLDAAFYHLKENAFRVVQVFVNDIESHLSHRLQEGDFVEFVIAEESHVSYKWLRYIETSFSRSFILEYLKHLPREEKVKIGGILVQREMDEMDLGYLSEVSNKKRSHAASHFKISGWDDLLLSVCEGEHYAKTIVDFLFHQRAQPQKLFDSGFKISRSDSPLGLTRVFDYLHKRGVEFEHVHTKKKGEVFEDCVTIRSRMDERESFVSFVSNTLGFRITPYSASSDVLLYAALMSVPILWSVNAVVSRYLLLEGLTVANATAVRLLSSAFVLFLIVFVNRYRFRDMYTSLSFSPLFWLITFVLGSYQYLIHRSLLMTESVNYMTVVAVSFVIAGMFTFKHPKLNRKAISLFFIPLSLCALSIFVLFQQVLGEVQVFGILVSFVVLFLHLAYNALGALYHARYEVKHRMILLLASMFLISGLFMLPFVSFQNFVEQSRQILAIALINGLITGGVAHYFFFVSRKKMAHSLVTFSMILIFVTTFVLGALFEGTGNAMSLFATALMVLATGWVGWWERKQELS